MRFIHFQSLLVGALLFFLAPLAGAGTPTEGEGPDSREALRKEFEGALQGLDAARQRGPLDVPLLEQAVLRLPAGFAFVPNPAASRFMATIGNRVDDSFLGLVLPDGEQADWVVSVVFEKSGYIRDDDAKSWNVDEMLKNLKEGAEETNRARASRGMGELEIGGWAEAPDYDTVSHRLVWALIVSNRGAPADEPKSVNYNTHALGREGYFSLNLVTPLSELEQRKPIARTLLASLEFNPGKKYEDFNAQTDPTAAYGLAALVGGAMVAKKLGLFALLSVFFAKFGKLIAIAAAALFGIFGKKWSKKRDGGSLDA